MARFVRTKQFFVGAFNNVHVRHVVQTIVSVTLSYVLTTSGMDCNNANAAAQNAAKIMMK